MQQLLRRPPLRRAAALWRRAPLAVDLIRPRALLRLVRALGLRGRLARHHIRSDVLRRLCAALHGQVDRVGRPRALPRAPPPASPRRARPSRHSRAHGATARSRPIRRACCRSASADCVGFFRCLGCCCGCSPLLKLFAKRFLGCRQPSGEPRTNTLFRMRGIHARPVRFGFLPYCRPRGGAPNGTPPGGDGLGTFLSEGPARRASPISARSSGPGGRAACDVLLNKKVRRNPLLNRGERSPRVLRFRKASAKTLQIKSD